MRTYKSSRPSVRSRTFAEPAIHLLLRARPEHVEKAIELSSFDRLSALEEKDGFAMKPKTAERFFRKGSVGEWKDVLSKAQVERIVTRHREQMERFGYVPSGY